VGREPIPARLGPGDVLFFNGNMIHGSHPNKTPDRWRRSLIFHTMPKSATHISGVFLPAVDFEGNDLTYAFSPGGGVCGEEFPAFWDKMSEDEREAYLKTDLARSGQ